MKTYDSDMLPVTAEGIEAFLASNRIEGIGPVFAKRIVESFGTDAFEAVRDRPEQIAEIRGVGMVRAEAAAESMRNLRVSPRLLAFLSSCGVSEMFIDRILGKYRKRAEEVILSDPYSMVEDVWQLSFFTADKIGRGLNIAPDDPRRLQASLVTAVKQFAEDGHLFAPVGQAIDHAAKISGVASEAVGEAVSDAVASGRLVESHGGLYLPVFFKAEAEGANKILALSAAEIEPVDRNELPRLSHAGHHYTEAQLDAIALALNSPVMILTGGPGSGKTTVLRGVIEYLERKGKRVTLCAPTGRAAKRMSTLTGSEAMTIHRLLGYRQGEGYNTRLIDTDMLIIDEGSMMEQVLFNHLLDALKPGTRVILVGDVDQLPAIGAGDVLRDLIDSGRVPVARLDENFRQSEGSSIAAAARAINAGEYPAVGRDFMIVEEHGQRAIHDKIIKLITTELPRTRGIDPVDILVVTPQQIGALGARQLNIDLQQCLNPDGPELTRGATSLRLGDPVMQKTNTRARGVYNGEIGRITAVDTEAGTLEVTFADNRKSEYSRKDLGELVPAYATTVHKLQGSETPNMIFPVTMAHRPMLYRNLLYTGVSRATDLCVLVGEPEAIAHAVANTPATSRHSNFKLRLRNVAESAARQDSTTAVRPKR